MIRTYLAKIKGFTVNFFKYFVGSIIYLYWKIKSIFIEEISVRISEKCFVVPINRLNTTICFELYFGWYEDAEREIIKSTDTGSENLVELGAAIGVVSCQLDTCWDPEKMISVEADRELIPYLRKNKCKNDCSFEISQKLIIYGEEEVFHKKQAFWSNSVHRSSTNEESKENSFYKSTKTTTLSEIIRKNFDREFSLVMDIEGMEIELIFNEKELLEEQCARILFEYHLDIHNKESVDEMIQTLKHCGFKEKYHHTGEKLFFFENENLI